MNGLPLPENGHLRESITPPTITEFIMTIAIQLIQQGMTNRQALEISQAVVTVFSGRFKGGPFRFIKSDNPNKLFLEAILSEKLQERGMISQKAGEMSETVINEFWREYLGMQLYIPMGSRAITPDIKAAILAEFKKNPISETVKTLSNKYGYSLRSIYRFIKGDDKGVSLPSRQNKHEERNRLIIAEYKQNPTPENIVMLADKYQIGRGAIYSVLWKERKPKGRGYGCKTE